MIQITERSNKAEIIDAAVELTEIQAEQIAGLKDDRRTLWFITGFLLITTILF